MKNVSGVLVSEKLGNYLRESVDELSDKFISINEFSDEAIAAALLEYSKFYRESYSFEDRLIYLYEKAYLFERGKPFEGLADLVVKEDDIGDFYVESKETDPW